MVSSKPMLFDKKAFTQWKIYIATQPAQAELNAVTTTAAVSNPNTIEVTTTTAGNLNIPIPHLEER